MAANQYLEFEPRLSDAVLMRPDASWAATNPPGSRVAPSSDSPSSDFSRRERAGDSIAVRLYDSIMTFDSSRQPRNSTSYLALRISLSTQHHLLQPFLQSSSSRCWSRRQRQALEKRLGLFPVLGLFSVLSVFSLLSVVLIYQPLL